MTLQVSLMTLQVSLMTLQVSLMVAAPLGAGKKNYRARELRVPLVRLYRHRTSEK
jgi:hypothetical protein